MITRSWPVWRQTKSRPSGENSIAVGGPERARPNGVSVNPAGKLAAVVRENARVSEAATTSGRIDFKIERGIEKNRGDFIELIIRADSTHCRNQGAAFNPTPTWGELRVAVAG